jgi:hypothetical protein
METAISIPDDLYREVEACSRRLIHHLRADESHRPGEGAWQHPSPAMPNWLATRSGRQRVEIAPVNKGDLDELVDILPTDLLMDAVDEGAAPLAPGSRLTDRDSR